MVLTSAGSDETLSSRGIPTGASCRQVLLATPGPGSAQAAARLPHVQEA